MFREFVTKQKKAESFYSLQGFTAPETNSLLLIDLQVNADLGSDARQGNRERALPTCLIYSCYADYTRQTKLAAHHGLPIYLSTSSMKRGVLRRPKECRTLVGHCDTFGTVDAHKGAPLL